MEVLSIIFIVGFCGAMLFIIYASLVLASRYDDNMEKERTKLNMENIYKEQLKRIKKYIENKTLKSFEVDLGLSNDMSNRMMTETVTELQIIASMIDEVMTYDDYEEGLLD